MLEKNPTLTQAEIEAILKNTALPVPTGEMTVFDLYDWETGEFLPYFYTYSWGNDSTGSGLAQADAALAGTPGE